MKIPKCPKCKSIIKHITEIVTMKCNWIVNKNNLLEATGETVGVTEYCIGFCQKCKHSWKIRKAKSIYDFDKEIFDDI
jgi:hypothetical protein